MESHRYPKPEIEWRAERFGERYERMKNYRRRRIIRAGWLIACILERTIAAFLFFFGSVGRIAVMAILACIVYGCMWLVEQHRPASIEQIKHYLTSNDARVNTCMVQLMPKRMVDSWNNPTPATPHMLKRAVDDCNEAIVNFDIKEQHNAVIKSLEKK